MYLLIFDTNNTLGTNQVSMHRLSVAAIVDDWQILWCSQITTLISFTLFLILKSLSNSHFWKCSETYEYRPLVEILQIEKIRSELSSFCKCQQNCIEICNRHMLGCLSHSLPRLTGLGRNYL